MVTMMTAIGSSPISGRSTRRSIGHAEHDGGDDADDHGDQQRQAASRTNAV